MTRTARRFPNRYATPFRVLGLLVIALFGLVAAPVAAQSHSRAEIEILAEYYADFYDVPLALVRRVINRESTFNPSARNGPYYGLMQILPETARTMGYQGSTEGLLNAETNLIYAVRYLRGAWLLAGGSHDRAVQLYAAGYYYHARDAGLLEQTGLRAGPNNPPLPQPVGVQGAVTAVAQGPEIGATQASGGGNRPRTLLDMFSGGGNTPQAAAQPSVPVTAPIAAAIMPATTSAPLAEVDQVDAVAAAPLVVALGTLPPRRPAELAGMTQDDVQVATTGEPTLSASAPDDGGTAIAAALIPSSPSSAPASEALLALAAITAPDASDTPTDPLDRLERELEWASAYAGLRPGFDGTSGNDLLGATFALLDPMQSLFLQAELTPGTSGFRPPLRPGSR